MDKNKRVENLIDFFENYLNSSIKERFFSKSDIKSHLIDYLKNKYGQNFNIDSYLMFSDYSYNNYTSYWGTTRLFEIEDIYQTRYLYKYLGPNYKYNGDVYDKNKKRIGYWANGIFTKNDSITDKYTWVPFFEELLDKICQNYNKETLYNIWHNFFPDRYNFIDNDENIPLNKIDPLSFIGKIISLGDSELKNKCEKFPCTNI